MSRRWLDDASAADLGRLDIAAIARVQEEAWPERTTRTSCTTRCMGLGFITSGSEQQRVVIVSRQRSRLNGAQTRAVARGHRHRGRCGSAAAIHAASMPAAQCLPSIDAPEEFAARAGTRGALREIVRGRLEGSGPDYGRAIAASLGFVRATSIGADRVGERRLRHAGQLRARAAQPEWCERRLLARIHRYTVKRLRQEIEPVSAATSCASCSLAARHADTRMEGPDARGGRDRQLEGFEAPAAAWEADILPARVAGYDLTWLDDLCLAGRVVWTRLKRRAPRSVRKNRARCAARRSPCCREEARAVDGALSRRRREPELSSSRAGGRATISRSTAPRSSTTSSPVLDCRVRSSKRRWASWSPSASSTRTASRTACAAAAIGRRKPFGGGRRAHSAAWRGGCRALGAHQTCAARSGSSTSRPSVLPRELGLEQIAHRAAPLRRCVLAPAGTRSRVAAAMAGNAARIDGWRHAARSAAVASSPDSRRAVRVARGRRSAAGSAASAVVRCPGRGKRRRSAESRRDRRAGKQGSRAHEQSCALPRRRRGRLNGRQGYSVDRGT